MTEKLLNQQASEPWMRGTHTDLAALPRGVIHALELALEDAERWAVPLSGPELFDRPFGLPSVSFHLLHIARSLDRLLTYAENRQLSHEQADALATEHCGTTRFAVLEEFRASIASSILRVALNALDALELPRGIGRMRLPTTVGGLLLHCAEHTQRHSGQMVTTAKVVVALRGRSRSA